MGNKIHLTSKTAMELRRNAACMKKLYYTGAALLSAALCVLAVFLGMKWLPAVPLIVLLVVALDVALVLHGRSIYLSMIGQAICTEAASREIHAGMSESRRRERAITDLIDAKADVQRAGMKQAQRSAKSFFEPENESALQNDQKNDGEDDRNAGRSAGDIGDAQGRPAARRRRRSDGLKLIKSGQAK